MWGKERITCICAKDSEGNWYRKVGGDEKFLIKGFLEWIRDRPPKDYLLITKNGRRFDIPYILARSIIKGVGLNAAYKLRSYCHFDLQYVTKKWVSLDDLARLFGCTPKLGTGANAVELWKQGRLEELLAYCAQDVKTTEEVYFKWKGLQPKD